MTNRLSSFIRADRREVAEPTISKAEAAGLHPPQLSQAERAGFDAEARLLKHRFEAAAAAQEKYQSEKAAYEQQRDEAIWKQILERQVAL